MCCLYVVDVFLMLMAGYVCLRCDCVSYVFFSDLFFFSLFSYLFFVLLYHTFLATVTTIPSVNNHTFGVRCKFSLAPLLADLTE